MTRDLIASVFFLLASVIAAGCGAFADLGFSNRVLHDVASPDGHFRAICQEVPAFDGPEYQTRLHLKDGTFVRNLAYGGDAQPCDSVVWSPDAKQLLVRASTSALLVDLEDARRNRHITINHGGDIPPQFRGGGRDER
jgi:hypothetical protein